MANNPILHLLGLAKRAGKLEIGEEPVGAVARARQAKLILLASDVSPNTSRRAATFGQAGNVLHLSLPYSKDELGMGLGRSSVAMVALTDAGFAGAIGDKLAEIDLSRYGAASEKLREKADRTLARQKEKRKHEKKLQRGKGKPWAVPPQTQEAQQLKREKKKAGKRSSGNEEHQGSETADKRFEKKPYQRDGDKHFEKKPYQRDVEKKSDNNRNYKPSTGKKLVIKRSPGPTDQS